MSERPLLEVHALKKYFPLKTGFFGGRPSVVHALDDVSFDLARGETLSVVGESGCGKSTLGKTILRLLEPTSGAIMLDGERVDNLHRSQLGTFRRRVQVVFQDPFSSLNPRQRVRDIIAEPIINFGLARGAELEDRVAALADKVRLPRDALNRFPHEFSGGQRQRVGIARALAVDPDVIVLDEPVSALDVSIQAGVLNLLEQLQDRLGLTYLLIAHDLAVVRHVSDDVAVMYLGRIVEQASADDLYERPQHPYTQALLSAVPVPDPRVERARTRLVLSGDLPSPADPPSGCRFRTRCWKATGICADQVPELLTDERGHQVACHHKELRHVV